MTSSRPANRPRELIVLAALIALAMVLRSPLTAVAPIVDDLRRGLTIGSVEAGLLTSIPVLCFGLLSPFASWFIARTTVECSILVTLGAIAVGLTLRSCGGIGSALSGTLILGAGITIGNIVSLMVIARDFPRRSRFVTGLYTSALNVGTMLTSAVTAPLAQALGWRIALAAAVVLVFPALALWSRIAVMRTPPSGTPDESPRSREHPPMPSIGLPPVWRRPLPWLLAGAFATHLCVYYSLSAWIPDYLIGATGMNATTAGLIASVFQILALLGSFGIPVLIGRFSAPTLMAGIALCWIVTPLGFLAFPQGWLLWSILGGIGAGGGFTVIFIQIMHHAADLADNRAMSAFVQGVGYTASAAGPLAVGKLHQAFGTWGPGLTLLSAMGCAMLACGLLAARQADSSLRP